MAERSRLDRPHIVDDDASFRKAMERRLKKAGYEVTTYPSAQHLLDRMPGESELGCILLDVRIPGMSGPEPQERLSKLGSTLPIIFPLVSVVRRFR
jgi:FixJ family two-component response regulator